MEKSNMNKQCIVESSNKLYYLYLTWVVLNMDFAVTTFLTLQITIIKKQNGSKYIW